VKFASTAKHVACKRRATFRYTIAPRQLKHMDDDDGPRAAFGVVGERSPDEGTARYFTFCQLSWWFFWGCSPNKTQEEKEEKAVNFCGALFVEHLFLLTPTLPLKDLPLTEWTT
jgi:hypothetical protein